MATKAHRAKRRATRKAKLPPELTNDKKVVSEAPKRLVLFVHGIRDPGFWAGRLQSLFTEHGFVAKAIGYGVFDAFRFLLGFRRRPTATVKQQIVNAISDDENSDAEVTIIAHSFGTYIVARILDDDPSIKITRLVMCGAIVRQTFRWDKVARLNVQKPATRVQIINENSTRDIWPIMARHATYGFGDCGATGCENKIDVQNRLHDIPHSAYLTLPFATQYWIPPIVNGLKLVFPKVSTRTPWFFFFTRIPIRIVTAVIGVLAGVAVYWLWDVLQFQTDGKFTKVGDVGVAVKIDGYTDRKKNHGVQLYTATDVQNKDVHRFRSDALLKIIAVTISNRHPLKCKSAAFENMDAYPLGTRAENLTTVFEFDLSDAYGFFGNAELDLAYHGRITKDNDEPQDDLLTVSGSGKFIPNKMVTLSVKHTEPCMATSNREMAEKRFIEKLTTANRSDVGRFTFATPAMAAVEVSSLDAQSVLDLLQKGDAEQRTVAIESIAADPAKYKAITEKYFTSALLNHAALADVIRAVRRTVVGAGASKSGASIALDSDKMILLAHAGPPQVRDAARSYLRAPGVATQELAAKFSGAAFEAKVRSLRTVTVNEGGRPYFQDYLLLITARDVFYNLGLNELVPYLKKIRNKQPGALDKVLRPFELGMKLRDLTNKKVEKVALAKNAYGKGLVLLEAAINREAANRTGALSVFQFIEEARAKFKAIDDQREAKKIGDQFGLFLAEVKGQEGLYPWPSHIEQAERCMKKLTYACLSSEVPEEQ